MEKTFTFTLTENEANLVLQALADVPYKISAGLISNLQSQANKQINSSDDKEEN